MKNVSVDLNVAQAAYLAGLVDGEGCLDFYKTSNKTCLRGYTFVARLTITNTKLDALISVADEIKAGKIMSKKIGPRRKPAYNLCFSPREVRVILPQILPYLRMKQKQAELLIAFLDRSSWYGNGKSRLISNDENTRRENLFLEMRSLNQRGSKLTGGTEG